MKNGVRNVLRYGSVVACFVLCVFSYALYERTFVGWQVPLTVAAAAAALTAPWAVGLWGRLTGSESRLLNYVCHVCFAGALGAFVFLGVNRFGADRSAVYGREFTVAEKITATRDRYRRVGRRSVRSGSYRVYYLRLASEDGTVKKIPVTQALYNKVRSGGTVTFSMYDGCFGYPVIE